MESATNSKILSFFSRCEGFLKRQIEKQRKQCTDLSLSLKEGSA